MCEFEEGWEGCVSCFNDAETMGDEAKEWGDSEMQTQNLNQGLAGPAREKRVAGYSRCCM